jgi:hypothetical protein
MTGVNKISWLKIIMVLCMTAWAPAVLADPDWLKMT